MRKNQTNDQQTDAQKEKRKDVGMIFEFDGTDGFIFQEHWWERFKNKQNQTKTH